MNPADETIHTTSRRSKRPPIQVAPEKCAGCLICQLRCSLHHLGSLVPGCAYIEIERILGGIGSNITFTDECDNCGVCAYFCPYGTLTTVGKRGVRDG